MGHAGAIFAAALCLASTMPARALEGGRPAAADPAAASTVAIETAQPVGARTRFGHCTGVAVAPTLVLTAAHCVVGAGAAEVAVLRFRDGRAAGPPLRVAAIVRDAASAGQWAARFRDIPERQRAIAEDLALLRLAAPGSVPALAIAGPSGGPLRILAAGALGPGREASGVLKSAALARLHRTTSGRALAFATPQGARVCPGDSGAPVIAETDAGPRLWGLVGAVIPDRDGCATRVIAVPLAGDAALGAMMKDAGRP